MRLWSLHPKYLDAPGLVALWREALLARAVLRGRTRGYRHHPQLSRFHSCDTPRRAISAYLDVLYAEAASRGYSFDRSKLGRVIAVPRIAVTQGQLAYEWEHLLRKLASRNPGHYRQWRGVQMPEAHPSFEITLGDVEPWERRAVPPVIRERRRAARLGRG